MSETTIPIRNLYHLLCYAWRALPERGLIDVIGSEPLRDLLDLLARVLSRALHDLVRRGLERGFTPRIAELETIRGRLLPAPTVPHRLPERGRAVCAFDELDHDTPANRILAETVRQLAASPALPEAVRHTLAGQRRLFRGVSPQAVRAGDFRRVVIHRNNRHLAFALDVCELILLHLLPETGSGPRHLRDFTRDHREMAQLFEKFVFAFCDQHREACGATEVSRIEVKWDGRGLDAASEAMLPRMRTDVVLHRTARPLVIECKFYTDAFARHHDTTKLRTGHLYQLLAYLRHLGAQPGWADVEGLLLYAENGEPFDHRFELEGRRLRAASLDLAAPQWQDIEGRLLGLVAAG